jgi:hypothetical protein
MRAELLLYAKSGAMHYKIKTLLWNAPDTKTNAVRFKNTGLFKESRPSASFA